jgi:hypothetical protein
LLREATGGSAKRERFAQLSTLNFQRSTLKRIARPRIRQMSSRRCPAPEGGTVTAGTGFRLLLFLNILTMRLVLEAALGVIARSKSLELVAKNRIVALSIGGESLGRC